MNDNVYLIVSSAFVLAGEIVTAGDLVEVTMSEARDLLNRGKARVATADDGVPQASIEQEEEAGQEEAEQEDDAGPNASLEEILAPDQKPAKPAKN